jgi:hypothetical protein
MLLLLHYDNFIEKIIFWNFMNQVAVNQANLRNDHIYLTEILSIFPDECIGGKNSETKGIELKISYQVHGKEIFFMTDIAGDKKIFRKRGKTSGTGMLLADLDVKDGDTLQFTKKDQYHFEVLKTS